MGDNVAVIAAADMRLAGKMESGAYYHATCDSNVNDDHQSESADDDEICEMAAKIGSLQNDQENGDDATKKTSDKEDCIACKDQCINIWFSRIKIQKGTNPILRLAFKGMAPIIKLEKSMKLAQDFGMKQYGKKIAPFESYFPYIWELFTYANVVVTLCLFLYTTISLAVKNKKNTVDFVYLGFSIVASFMSFLDLGITSYFYKCRLACDLSHWVSKKCVKKCNECDPSCCTSNYCNNCNCQECCCCGLVCCDHCCNRFFKNKWSELARLLLIDVFVYPLTMCSMLRVFLNIIHDKGNISVPTGFSIAAFVGTLIWHFFFIYVLRTVVIVRTIFAIQKLRDGGPEVKTGKSFHKSFFVHVMGQMVSQIVMIVSIGAKMYHENRNFLETKTVQVSPFLWYTIIGGFVIPLAGIFTFAIANFYSVQEYPIGFFLDLLFTTIKKRRPKDVVSPSKEENKKGEMSLAFKMSQEAEKDAQNIADRIESEFTNIHKTSALNKYGYVYQSPLLVALSIVYAIFLLIFAICCVLEPDPTTAVTEFVVLNDSPGWIAFFIVGVILVNLLNILVLLIAGVWMAIIIGVLLLIAFVILLLVLSCCVGDSRSTQRH